MSTQQDFSEYTAIIDISPDSCGEATQEQVNEITGQIRTNLELIFPGLRTDTGLRTSITGPDEETCEEIHRAIFRQFERKMAEIANTEPSPEDLKASLEAALLETAMLKSALDEHRGALQGLMDADSQAGKQWIGLNMLIPGQKRAHEIMQAARIVAAKALGKLRPSNSGTAPRINYSPEIDAIIYSHPAKRLTRNQYLDLAKAAIDQALSIEEAAIQANLDTILDSCKDEENPR